MPNPLDLKSTINLPRTDFSMKANLPQNEPKLAGPLGRRKTFTAAFGTARRDSAAVHSARWPSLRQRPHPPGHGAE